MTQLHPRDPENRQHNQFSERRFSGKNQLQPVELETGYYRWIITDMSVYIKRSELIGRYGVMTLKTRRLHMYKLQRQVDLNGKRC